MIRAVELVKSYGRTEAVRGVSFEVNRGDILGLLGPNGAGKTSIIKILTGYHFPDGGSAMVEDLDVGEHPLEIKRLIGYLPESAPLYPDQNPEEYLSFVADARGLEGAARKAAIEKAVAACGLSSVWRKPVEELSKGFRQRLGLAQAILHDPPVLILDEPTTGLDPNQILEIRNLIMELGKEKTVIISTHILQEVEAVCSSVVILNEGLVAAQGTPEEIGEALKGEERLGFRIKARNHALCLEDFRALLGTIPGIRAILRCEGDGSPAFAAEISFAKAGTAIGHGGDQGADEFGEAVFDWAVSRDLVLLELSRRRLSLEEIFVKLTQEGGRA